jgi:hypothetical protein
LAPQLPAKKKAPEEEEKTAVKHQAIASSFADEADLAAFKRCKVRGGSDNYCFNFGDNGIGCWGDSTVAGTGPCCALTKATMVSKWGSMKGAKHKPVRVQKGEKQVTCILKDVLGVAGRIDLNPDACEALGISIPAHTPVVWWWA